MPIYASGAPKPETKTPADGHLTPDRTNPTSVEDITDHSTDDINQTVEVPDKDKGRGTTTDDLSLVREGTQGQEDLGYTR